MVGTEDFTIYRAVDEGKQGLYCIRYKNYYVTQSGNSVALTTEATDGSYWSLMKTAKGTATIISFNATDASGNRYNTSEHNSAFISSFSTMGYNCSATINESPFNSYSRFRTDDMIFYHGHSVPGALIFTQNWSSTSPYYSGGIASHESIPTAAYSGIQKNYMYFIDDLFVNNMKNARVVFYLSCNSGISYVDADTGTEFNLVDATYEKGAHFVLGTTETTYNVQVYDWMDALESNLTMGNNLQTSITNTRVAMASKSYIIDTNQNTVDGDFGIYYVGDNIQFIN